MENKEKKSKTEKPLKFREKKTVESKKPHKTKKFSRKNFI